VSVCVREREDVELSANLVLRIRETERRSVRYMYCESSASAWVRERERKEGPCRDGRPHKIALKTERQTVCVRGQ